MTARADRRNELEAITGDKDAAMGEKVLTPSIAPTLNFVDADGAIKWLEDVLGFEVSALFRDKDGTIAHAQLVWRDGAINLSQTTPDAKLGPSSIALTAEDESEVDSYYERALRAGGNVVTPPEEAFTGQYRFQARDPDGNRWNVGTPWINGEKALALPQRMI